MASGAWEWGGANSWTAGRLEFVSFSNGSAANSSGVTVRLYARRVDGGTSYNYNSSNFWITINGSTTYRTSGCTVAGSGWTLVHSYSLTVPHNADGSKTITIGGGGSITGTSFNMNNYSVNVGLDKIPRYATIKTFRNTEVTQTSAAFSWTADSACDAVQYAIGSGSYVSVSGGTFTIQGLSPNTSYSVKIRIRRKDSQLWTTSGTVSVKTVPIAGIAAESDLDFNIGENLSLCFQNSDKNDSYLKFSARLSDGTWTPDLLTADIPKDTASHTLDTHSITDQLYGLCPASNELPVRLIMGTVINGKNYENIYTGKGMVTDSNPDFADYSYCNTDAGILEVLGNPSYIPQNLGNMQAQISAANRAIGRHGASVVKYEASVSDAEGSIRSQKDAVYSDNADVRIDFGAFPASGVYCISIQAVDSRGNVSSVVQKHFTVLPYHRPVTDIHLERVNGYEQEVIMDLHSVYSRLLIGNTQKNNSFFVRYRYCAAGTADWSDYMDASGYQNAISAENPEDMKVTLKYAESSPILTLPSQNAYHVEFVISDKISSTSEKLLLSEGIPLMLEASNGKISVGMIPDWSNPALLQVAGDILATDTQNVRRNLLEELDLCIGGLDRLNGSYGYELIKDASGWLIKKYHNGFCELFITFTTSVTSYVQSSIYYGFTWFKDYPFTFYNTPEYIYSVQISNGFGFAAGNMGGTKTKAHFHALGNTSGKCSIRTVVKAWGWWKKPEELYERTDTLLL